MRNILRINMGKRQYELEPMTDVGVKYGGRALSSKLIAAEVPAKCDPLGIENKLVFAPGTLAGTTVPNGGRLSIGAKSPLTHTIKEANAGGEAARKLARLGIHAVIVEGASESLCNLKIDKSGVTFLQAPDYKGAGNEAVINKIRTEHGDKVAVISNGLAGEWKLRAAGIAVTSPDFHPRMAARGGLGAVMGSKNLKAIIVDDHGAAGVAIKNKDVFKSAAAAVAKGITENPFSQGLKALGTPMLVDMTSEGLGCLPTRNYTFGKFEGADRINGESLNALINERPNGATSHRCMTGCVISCSNVLTDDTGGIVTSGIEYETIGLVGSNCMIDDMEVIAKINRECNNLGLDTMEIGGALAIAMEHGLLEWGDGPAALDLIGEIAKGTDTGLMIGNGCKYTGDFLKVNRIPHVKGQCLAAYDPRALKGTGVTYATSPMGADHTCGNVFPSENKPEYNHLSADGQVEASRDAQIFMAAVDSLGLCLFASVPMEDPELLGNLVACVSEIIGQSFDESDLMALGAETLKIEKQFNAAAGFKPEDDRLPDFFLTEPLATTETVFDVSEAAVDSLYDS